MPRPVPIGLRSRLRGHSEIGGLTVPKGEASSARLTGRSSGPHAMHQREKVRLLFGPYTPPPLRRGERSVCLYRDADFIVTSWSAGRIQWPRCRALDAPGPGSGLLVNEELAPR